MTPPMPPMNDEEDLQTTWTTLEPTADERRRISIRVAEWLDAHDTSIAEEWLGMVKTRPIAALSLAAAGAVAIAVSSPFLWVARALI